jgi:site-specific DNA-methyltransferase (adenine-specific)
MIKRVEKVTDKITLYNCDCMEYMKNIPDKYFDLAIVDPPYGIGANKMQLGNGKRKIYRGKDDWDKEPPSEEYFKELFRVSKNQVIWGANHFISNIAIDSSCWIFWDKGTGDNDFADGELAWTSFKTTVRKFFKSWVGANAKERDEKDRMHPTQKPIALYEWILKNYAKPTDKILDTHFGSCSIGIACHNFGCSLDACELDEEYFDNALERVKLHVRQLDLFK